MTSAYAVVAALVAGIVAGHAVRHLGGLLRRRLSGRSKEMTSAPTSAVASRPGPPPFPLRIYHWRWEILAVTAVPCGLVVFALAVGPLWASASLAAVLVLGLLRRRHVRARVRAVVLQHRLRAAFALLHLPGGTRPAILWSRPRSGDVVVSLYGRDAFEQLHRRRAVLAVACSAPEVYVDRHPRFADLVTLTISTTEAHREPGRAQLPSTVVPMRAHS